MTCPRSHRFSGKASFSEPALQTSSPALFLLYHSASTSKRSLNFSISAWTAQECPRCCPPSCHGTMSIRGPQSDTLPVQPHAGSDITCPGFPDRLPLWPPCSLTDSLSAHPAASSEPSPRHPLPLPPLPQSQVPVSSNSDSAPSTGKPRTASRIHPPTLRAQMTIPGTLGLTLPQGAPTHRPRSPTQERSRSPRHLRCAAENAAWARAKRPTPTSPFHSDGAMIPEEQQPNKRGEGRRSCSFFHWRVSAQRREMTSPNPWARSASEVEKPKSREKAEAGMPGRRGKRHGIRSASDHEPSLRARSLREGRS